MKDRLRITVWPTLLPHPPVLVFHRYALAHDQLSLQPTEQLQEARFADVAVEEIYLNLLTVDLESPESIEAFVNEYGPLGVRKDDFSALGGIPSRHHLIRTLRDAVAGRPEDPYGSETLYEFRVAANWLGDLTNLWRLWRTGGSRAQDMNWHYIRSSWVKSSRNYVPAMLRDGLSPALLPFRPALIVRSTEIPTMKRKGTAAPNRAVEVEWAHVPLFSVLALELFNHVAGNEAYKTCANPTCRRLFVRHDGRSQSGHHRIEGVRYCSTRCLRQQIQREYRARKKENNDG